MIALLNRVDDRIANDLATRQIGSAPFTERRLQLMLEAIRVIVKEGYTTLTANLDKELKEFAKYEFGHHTGLIQNALPMKWEFVGVSPNNLYAAVHARPFQGRLLKDTYRDLEEGAFKRVRDKIRMGWVEGRGTDQIVRDIIGTKGLRYKDGITEVSRNSLRTVVRTAVTHTSNVARGELYKQNRRLIKGVEWVSTLDGRTSAICRSRDGMVFDVDKGPRPPAHLNCRSTTIPIIKSWSALGVKGLPAGQRASMNGQVAGDLTYSSWLRKQPKDFQEDVLGVKKAQLFRRGKIDLDRFVDRNGKELTLDQLRQREPDAWEAAKLAA
jgi:SPP1 gp7 family putative phage head morphogenesis protein